MEAAHPSTSSRPVAAPQHNRSSTPRLHRGRAGRPAGRAHDRAQGPTIPEGKERFRNLLERLCEMKARWCALVEHAPMSDGDKWKILALLMAHDDARLEELPSGGLGVKVTLPPRQRH